MTLDLSVGFRSVLAMAAGVALIAQQPAQAGPASDSNATAQVYRYQSSENDSYFALAIRANILGGSTTAGRQHFVLVDTSASQVAGHRQQAISVLESFLASLPEQDTVQLVAIDVTTKSMSEGFVSPRGSEMTSAVAELKQRAPLGATNLLRGLESALKSIDQNTSASVLYIGDGMSTAQLVQSQALQDIVSQYRTRHVAINSYAVGPQTDLQLLGILGQQTGGLLLIDQIDQKQDAPDTIGKQLAKAANAPVFYASDIKLNAPGVELLPQQALPLRGDRETIYIGHGSLESDLQVTVNGEWNNRQRALSWNISQNDFKPGHALLANSWNRLSADGGFAIAYAGVTVMHEAEVRFEREVERLVSLGEQAVSTRNLTQAEKIGRMAESADPNNIHVKSLLGSVEKIRMQMAARSEGVQIAQTSPVPTITEEPPAPVGVDERVDIDPDADLIEREIRRRAALSEQLTQEINQTINLARQISRDEPEAALSLLKKSLGIVSSTSDLDPDIRARMERDLRATMQQINTEREVTEIAKEKTLARRTQIEANARLQESILLEDQKLSNLISQVRGLIYEGIHGDDNAFEQAERVAEVAVDLQPGNAIATAARFTAESAGQLRRSFRLRALRADRFLDTLHQVELSHVPFPDEPPIRWPNAAVWRALTERRKKWAAVDLRRDKPSEERIRSALDEETELQFAATPLREALQFLADQHGYNMYIENTVLEELGVDLEGIEIESLVLSGITLRSALRLLLEPHELTYVIEDEVMKITTQEAAESKMTTRIYPVGDLVVSFEQLSSGVGGAGGLGAAGGIGGGQQGGGFGGGQQGGGGGGFGGGQFSIPAEDFSGKAPNAGKKKP